MTNVTRLTVLTTGQPGVAPPPPPSQMGPMSFIGNPSATFGPAIELTMPQATAMLSLFTPTLQGVVPASGGGTANFLRADGTWSPAGFGDILGPAVVGNIAATLGPPGPLTPAQLTSMVQLFTASTSGTVPASGGGALNFLRADGIWALPPSEEPMPGNTVWGNPAGTLGPGQPMTSSQLTPLISLFTATTSGTVPASGGGTTYVLHADGTWGLTAAESPIPPYTLWGNFSPATAAPGPVTTTQLTSMISLFTASDAGIVPASGGGSDNFLRADGIWTSPPGIAPIPPDTVLGNSSSTTSVPGPLTQAQLTSLVNLFTATTPGTVPASGGGQEKFLRADGTWADVPEFPLPLGPQGWPFVGNGPLPPSYRQLTSDGIAPGGVHLFNIEHIAAGTVLGNDGPNAHSPEALTGTEVTRMLDQFTTTHQGVVPPSTNLGFFLRGDGTWATPSIADIPIPPGTVMGNVGGVAATPVAINQTQLTTLINIFTATLKGAVPPSGGGTANWLRADGAWAIPPHVPLIGGTMTGFLTLNDDPTQPLHAATKQYVDDQIDALSDLADDTFLPLAGGTMTGAIVLHAAPTADMQAANKGYVDEAIASQALYQGTWDADANDPDLTDTDLHVNGYAWIAITPDPLQPFTITHTIPGLTNVEINNGDRITWSDAANEFQVVRGSTLSLAEAESMFLPFTGGTMTGALTLDGDATTALQAVPLQQLNARFPATGAEEAYVSTQTTNQPLGATPVWERRRNYLRNRGAMPVAADWNDAEYLDTGFWSIADATAMSNLPTALQGKAAAGIFSVERDANSAWRKFVSSSNTYGTWEQHINPTTLATAGPRWRQVVAGTRQSTGAGAVTSLVELFALEPGLHQCRGIEDLPLGNCTVLVNAYGASATLPGAKTFIVQDTWDQAGIQSRIYVGTQWTSSTVAAPNYGWSGWKRLSDDRLARPYEWTPNVEMDFGNDLRGFRATGFITQVAGTNFQRVINTAGRMNEVLAHGGWVRPNSAGTSPYYGHPLATGAVNTTPTTLDHRYIVYSWGATSGLVFNCTMQMDTFRAPYDLWVLYRRTPEPEGAQLPVPDNIAINGNVLTWDAVPDALQYAIRINGITRVTNNTTRTYTIPGTWVATQTHSVQVMAVARNNLELDPGDPTSEIFRNSNWSTALLYGTGPNSYRSTSELANIHEWQVLTVTRRTGVTAGTFEVRYNPFLRLLGFYLHGVTLSGIGNGLPVADVSIPPSVVSRQLRPGILLQTGSGATSTRRAASLDMNTAGVLSVYLIDDFVVGEGTALPDGATLWGDAVIMAR